MTLQELLLARSMPVLTKVLGPTIGGQVKNNFRIANVRMVNRETVVTYEITKDPLVNINTATTDQIRSEEVVYRRHHMKNVFEHILGYGPFHTTVGLPSDVESFNTWLTSIGIDLTLSADEVTVTRYGLIVSIFPKNQNDLKWRGSHQMVFIQSAAH